MSAPLRLTRASRREGTLLIDGWLVWSTDGTRLWVASHWEALALMRELSKEAA